MRNCFLALMTFAVVSCASDPHGLTVDRFHLRDIDPTSKNAAMVRGAQMKRLYGAVSVEERRQRLGQYYTVLWKPKASSGRDRVIEMSYLQASSASKVLKKRVQVPDGVADFTTEFAVIGEDYQNGGRVLAWKIVAKEGGKVVDSQQSYLWE